MNNQVTTENPTNSAMAVNSIINPTTAALVQDTTQTKAFGDVVKELQEKLSETTIKIMTSNPSTEELALLNDCYKDTKYKLTQATEALTLINKMKNNSTQKVVPSNLPLF